MIKQTLENRIKRILKNRYSEVQFPKILLFDPSKEIEADYYTNVAFFLAKRLGKNVKKISEEIIKEIMDDKMVKSIIGDVFEQNGFINFKLNKNLVEKKIIEISKNGFGEKKLKKQNKNKKIIIDYSSPNIAKKMHVGHLRSTIIGDALKKIFLWLGYNVISWNHLGDFGTQFGKLLVMYKKKYGNEIVDIKITDLEKLYVEFNKKAQNNPAMERQAKEETKKLQYQDKHNIKLWKYFTKISLKEFNKIYKILDVEFDYIIGESFYQKYLPDVIKNALKKKIAIKSQGAVIIPLKKFNLPPYLIQKDDGAFLYSTTDLALFTYRIKKFKPNKIIFVVSNEQSLHFEQLFASAKLLGLLKKNVEAIHIKFGLLLNAEGKKFSTRQGDPIYLEDLITKVTILAYKLINEKNPDLKEDKKQKIAKDIAIGAIKYNDLSRDRQSDIVFDEKRMLSLQGNSAPYLQYTFVRINSILNKAPKIKSTKIFLINPIEKKLAVKVLKLKDAVYEAAKNYKPNILADYLYNLASDFHLFYETLPVLKADVLERNSRLILIQAVSRAIKEGLALLGIKAPNKM